MKFCIFLCIYFIFVEYEKKQTFLSYYLGSNQTDRCYSQMVCLVLQDAFPFENQISANYLFMMKNCAVLYSTNLYCFQKNPFCPKAHSHRNIVRKEGIINFYFQEIQIFARHDKINNGNLIVLETAQLYVVAFAHSILE